LKTETIIFRGWGETRMLSVCTLLNAAVDYAGLFPPASLSMRGAIQMYSEDRAGSYSSALGRFVVPASRLVELGQSRIGREGWHCSVLGGADYKSDLEHIMDFEARSESAIIDAVELKARSIDEIDRSLDIFPNRRIYFEIPVEEDCCGLIEGLAVRGVCAKVRTGGVMPDLFPSPAQLARFILLCAGAHVPFKATAGLHHPVRSLYPLTYDLSSPSVIMHGFLNVLLASAAAYALSDANTVGQILQEDSINAFTFEEDAIGWKHLRFAVDQLREMRERFFLSFGSCSFREPVSGLQALNLL
jgi:hypothetical protein